MEGTYRGKGVALDKSLSLIVPVHNAERALSRQVARLLDLLPDLTQRFEVVIVDDASTDHTADVAAELARTYPQVRFLPQSKRLGEAAAARRGMQQATGEVVLLQEEIAGLGSADLRKLWNERREAGLRIARSAPQPTPFESPLMDRLSAWGKAVQVHEPSESADANLRFTIPDLGRADPSHASATKAKPVRSFLRHLRELTLGE